MALNHSIPGPGHLGKAFIAFTSIRNPLKAAHSLKEKYGDIAYVEFRSIKAVLISHPSLVSDVLIKHNAIYAKDQRYRSMPEVLGEGMLTTHGERWTRQRMDLKNIYNRESLEEITPTIHETARDALDSWSNQTTCDMHAEMKKITASLVYRLVLGREAPSLSESAERLTFLLKYWNHRGVQDFMKLPNFFFSKLDRKFEQTVKTLRMEIDEAVSDVQSTSYIPTRGIQSLVTRLVATEGRQSSQNGASAAMAEQVMTFLLAGFDTSSSLLTWVFWHLAISPTLQEKVTQECLSARSFNNENSETILLDAVINETARLFPPVWGLVARQRKTRPWETSRSSRDTRFLYARISFIAIRAFTRIQMNSTLPDG